MMAVILDYSTSLSWTNSNELGWLDQDREVAKYSTHCPQCGTRELLTTRLEGQDLYDLIGPRAGEYTGGTTIIWIEVLECQGCGWWQLERQTHDGVGSDAGGVYSLHKASLKEFISDGATTPVEVLAQHINRSEDLIRNINPTKLEELVGSVFRDFYSCEVTHCGQSHDHGIDLLLIQGEETIPIQVKRRLSPNSVEGVKVVREMFGVMFRDGYQQAKVVSTASRFSRYALAEVEKVMNEHRCESFELVNLDAFLQILNLRQKGIPPSWITKASPRGDVRTFFHDFLEKSKVKTPGRTIRRPVAEIIAEQEEVREIRSKLDQLSGSEAPPEMGPHALEHYLLDTRPDVSATAAKALLRYPADRVLAAVPSVITMIELQSDIRPALELLDSLGVRAAEAVPSLIRIAGTYRANFRHETLAVLIRIVQDKAAIVPVLQNALIERCDKRDDMYLSDAAFRLFVVESLEILLPETRDAVVRALYSAINDSWDRVGGNARRILRSAGEHLAVSSTGEHE
jgi:restriction system protein